MEVREAGGGGVEEQIRPAVELVQRGEGRLERPQAVPSEQLVAGTQGPTALLPAGHGHDEDGVEFPDGLCYPNPGPAGSPKECNVARKDDLILDFGDL